MKPLAIIPARAGSKRLPDKNLQDFHGVSLLEHAIKTVLMIPQFVGRTAVTTDMGHIPSTSIIGINRPKELAQDDTPMMDVVRHAVKQLRSYGLSFEFDAVVLLQPTSPLRTPADIKAALALLEGCDAVVSVVEDRHPEVYTMGHGGRLRPVDTLMDGRRIVVPNGAIYAIHTSVLDRGEDWWTALNVRGYEMPAARSIDIDTGADLERARELWAKQQA